MNNFNFEGYKNAQPNGLLSSAQNIESAKHIIECMFSGLEGTSYDLFKELDALHTYLDNPTWCKYAVSMLEKSGTRIEELSAKIKDSVDEIHSKHTIKPLFSAIERYLSCSIRPECCQSMFKTVAQKAYELTGDKRYKLFLDFSGVFFSNEINTQRESIKKLKGYYESERTIETKRNIIYLMVLATQRLCVLSGATVISDSLMREKYNECFRIAEDDSEFDFEEYRIDSLFNPKIKMHVPKLIIDNNCPEIVSIFDTRYYYYDGNFLRSIQLAAKEAIEKNKYTVEIEPVISQNLSFCRNI